MVARSAALTRTVTIPMRDGVALIADVVTPGPGSFPVLLHRTPYDRRSSTPLPLAPTRDRLVELGYAVVWQDVRGRGESGGAFEPFVAESTDGADTIAWLREHTWV